MVPFHVACIRNIKFTDDGDYIKSRFNFVSPNIATNLNIQYPEIDGNIIYLTSIQMRGSKELKQICSRIEAKMKNYKI